MPSRGAVYFNPSSGPRRELLGQEVRKAAEEFGLEFVEVGKAVDVSRSVAERVAAGSRLFVAAGGDGTINSVMQSLVHTEAVLAVLPVGTLNHFARDIGVPLDWRAAFEIVLRGAVQQIDVGCINRRYFLNNISLGLYPELVKHRERLRHKTNRTWRAYAYAAWAVYQRFPHVSIALETPHHAEAIRTHVFMVSVNPYDLSGFGIVAPRTSLESGRLCVYWLPHMPKVEFVRTVARYVRGRITAIDGFRSLQTTHLRVQSSRSELRVGMDGELFELHQPLAISVEPKSLLVRVPRG
ncbi:MAG TPA: diacylglycerol kinase family protein [Thermoanaerobaculia bacterium]